MAVTTIVLDDEPMRSVVTMALWDGLNPFRDLETLAMDLGDPQVSEADRRTRQDDLDQGLTEMNRARAEIEVVSSAAVGDTVTVEMSPERCAARLRSQRAGMEENPDLCFKASANERSRMLTLYDAAGVLLERLPGACRGPGD
jgi:hypothetical protein